MSSKVATIDDARRLLIGSFGQELARLPELYTAPLHARAPDGAIRNGSTFFLDCGRGPFGVTARHVYEELVQQIERGGVCHLGVCGAPFDLGARLISKGRSVDIATYRVEPAEVTSSGVRVLSHSGPWPPPVPQVNQGLVFGGYPGVDREGTHQTTHFVGTSGSGVADSINDRDISCLLDREYMMPIAGMVFPPVGVNLAGMSGAPVLALTNNDLFGWHLAGVVYEASRDLMEMLKIVRAHFISEDGTVTE